MSNFFNPDNAFFSGMGKLFDMIILNLIWIVMHVPAIIFFSMYRQMIAEVGYPSLLIGILLSVSLIITVPSLVAMYYAVAKSIRRSRSYAVKEFFRAFKANFKQGSIASVVFTVIGWLLYIDFQYAYGLIEEGSSKGVTFLLVFIAITFFVLGWIIYFCPVLSRFSMKTGNAFKFSFGLSAKHILYTLLSVLLWVGIALIVYLSGGFFLLFVVSLGTLVESFMMEKILKTYMLKMIEDQKAASAEGETQDGSDTESSDNEESEADKKDEWYLE